MDIEEKRSTPLFFLVLPVLILPLAAGLLLWWLPERARERRGRNERTATTMLTTLASAEADFRGNDRDGNGVDDFWTGDVAGLYYLPAGQGATFPELRLIMRKLADADAMPLQARVPEPVPYYGYYFVAMKWDASDTPPSAYTLDTDKKSGKVHHREKFGFCAYPEQYGVTGRETFIINEGNTIFMGDTKGVPVYAWPGDQELMSRWSKPE
jgi:hypothetical protein